jgi:hypothetical protein
MRKRKTLFVAVLLVLPLFLLTAQEGAVLHLYYAEGDDLTLTVGGRAQTYSEYDFPDEGVPLGQGDLVVTGRESSAELQIRIFDEEPSYGESAELPGALIKLTEGSTLRFHSFADGEVTLELLYGQLRVVSGGSPAGGDDGTRLKIRAGNAVVDVSDGDFDVDYAIHPGESLIENGRNGSRRLQVYSFRGSTAIVLSGNNSTTTFAVKEYERVAIEAGSTRSVIERKPLDPEILSYWESMPFTGDAPDTAPDTTLPERGSRLVMTGDGQERYVIFPVIDAETAALTGRPQPVVANDNIVPSSGERKKLILKNAFLITGTVLSGIGLGANLYGLYGSNSTAAIAANYGFVPLGLGVVSLIVACIINPKIP